MTISSNAPSAPSSATWQPQDQEAIRQCLALPATVPCLDAIARAMADLLRQHPAGVLSARALLDAVPPGHPLPSDRPWIVPGRG